MVDPNSGHSPPENKTARKRKQHKSTDVHALPGMSSPSLQQHNSDNSGFFLETMQWPSRATAQQTTPASASAQSNAEQLSNFRFQISNHIKSTKMLTYHKSPNGAASGSYYGTFVPWCLPSRRSASLSSTDSSLPSCSIAWPLEHRTKLSIANVCFGCWKLAFRIFPSQVQGSYATRQRKKVLWLWCGIWWKAQKSSVQHCGQACRQVTCSKSNKH